MLRFETDRCIVRRFLEKDIEFFANYRNDEKWMKYQGFKGFSKEEYRNILLKEPVLEEGAQWAIASKCADKIMGDLYLKKIGDEFQIGYTISPLYARQGYISEAVLGLIDWIKKTDAKKISGSVVPENQASIHLLEKLGFKHIKINEDGENVYVLEM